MDFFDAVSARRSVRTFDPQPVPRDVLLRIVAAGVEAPAGRNAHLTQYIIVDDPATMNALRPLSRAIGAAPAVIAVLVDPQGEYWVEDVAAAMENMLLAATAQGWASCWIEGRRAEWEPLARQILGVPDHLRVWAMTPIGKPSALPPRPDKPTADEITHFNRYGQR